LGDLNTRPRHYEKWGPFESYYIWLVFAGYYHSIKKL
jgi:hypothetical protein